MLQASYQPLSKDCPDWGEIAVLPWDAEIFGFPVADLRIRDVKLIATTRPAFEQALSGWAAQNRVELVACVIDGADGPGHLLLSQMGFLPVEDTLRITHSQVQATDFYAIHIATFSKMPEPIRLAEPADQAEVERIAEQSFRTGRYHADSRFPRHLADLRYRYWMRNVFSSPSPQNRLYVSGEPGHPAAFFHFEIEGQRAQISIVAVDKPFHNQALGYDVGSRAMADLKEIGIHRVTSKISVANTGVMNLAAHYGFRFSSPQTAFHWHAADAPHLLSVEAALTAT